MKVRRRRRSAATHGDDDLEPIALGNQRLGVTALGTISPLRSTARRLPARSRASSRPSTVVAAGRLSRCPLMVIWII